MYKQRYLVCVVFSIVMTLALALFNVNAQPAHAEQNGLALTPPMG